MFTLTAFWSRLGTGAALACALAAGMGAHATTIDPNTPASAFSGVVSINVQYGGNSFICSGALIGAQSVVTSGSCVDTAGNGTVIDLNQPGASVTVVFNSDGAANAIIAASKVTLNPDFKGFGICADGSSGCQGNDLAVLTLATAAPATAQIYSIATNPVTSGASIITAGYGMAGDGTSAAGAASFTVKTTGANTADAFDPDANGNNDVFYADFDGNGIDSFCDKLDICNAGLPAGIESTIAAGDIGGPAFVLENGQLALVGIDTLIGTFAEYPDGTFGSYFGGVLLAGYTDFLTSASTAVPEPGSVALMGLGVLLLAGARRRTRKY